MLIAVTNPIGARAGARDAAEQISLTQITAFLICSART